MRWSRYPQLEPTNEVAGAPLTNPLGEWRCSTANPRAFLVYADHLVVAHGHRKA
jgi:hypothetical protein